ncbi:hypothetical protein GB882_03140, partial [Georgenia ruanii]|nr:hypothetical protein [Georgenia ruanii]
VPFPRARTPGRPRPVALALLVALAALLVTVTGTASAESSYTRLAGEDRYATAVTISRYAYQPRYGGDQFAVTVASGTELTDALAAGLLAGSETGPLLLVPEDGVVPPVVTQELARLHPYLVNVTGGAGSVSGRVETQLTLSAPFVFRLAGRDRYETAAAAARTTGARQPTVFLAGDGAVADALGGSAAAGESGGALLLTRRESLPEPTRRWLAAHDPAKVVVLGGQGSVSDAVVRQLRGALPGVPVERWSGRDRYETAAVISRQTYPHGARTVFLASGTSYADALTGAPAAARSGAPLLLTTRECLPPATDAEISRLGATSVVVLGGKASVGEEAAHLTVC